MIGSLIFRSSSEAAQSRLVGLILYERRLALNVQLESVIVAVVDAHQVAVTAHGAGMLLLLTVAAAPAIAALGLLLLLSVVVGEIGEWLLG